MIETAHRFVLANARLIMLSEEYYTAIVEDRLKERDAAIRKECADRGVKWAMTALGPLIMNSETRDELRAEIMGDE